MAKFKHEKVEVELDIVVPEIYKMFMDAVKSKGLSLKKYGICNSAKSLIKTNEKLRMGLDGQNPKWKEHYLSLGIGDGFGNYYFIEANNIGTDEIKLWAHDPPGIEDIATASVFLKFLLEELESDFKGSQQFAIQGIAEK